MTMMRMMMMIQTAGRADGHEANRNFANAPKNITTLIFLEQYTA
jgi:hypothetical protein